MTVLAGRGEEVGTGGEVREGWKEGTSEDGHSERKKNRMK